MAGYPDLAGYPDISVLPDSDSTGYPDMSNEHVSGVETVCVPVAVDVEAAVQRHHPHGLLLPGGRHYRVLTNKLKM